MGTRASYYRAEAKHSQRQGAVKPKLPERDTDTVWLGEFLSSAAGIGPFNVHSLIVLPLGHTPEEREIKLRKASSMGALRMSAHRVDGVFVEYRWELA